MNLENDEFVLIYNHIANIQSIFEKRMIVMEVIMSYVVPSMK